MSMLCLDCGKLNEGKHQCSKSVLVKYCFQCHKNIAARFGVCPDCEGVLLEGKI